MRDSAKSPVVLDRELDQEKSLGLESAEKDARNEIRHSTPASDFEWEQVTLRFSILCKVEGCDNLH